MMLFSFFQKLGPVPSSPLNQPKTRDQNKPQPWKMSCLRPAPPSRGYPNQNEAGSKRNSISSKTNLLKKGKYSYFLHQNFDEKG